MVDLGLLIRLRLPLPYPHLLGIIAALSGATSSLAIGEEIAEMVASIQ